MVEALGTWIGALFTAFLFGVTLFQIGLLDRWFGPRIELSWNEYAPCLQAMNPADKGQPNRTPFQVRLRASNVGFREAKQVSILLKAVRLLGEGDDYEVRNFVPARLSWTHLEKPLQSFIAPESFALCDFAQLLPSTSTREGYERVRTKELQGVSVSNFDTVLCVEKHPATGGSVFGGGSYQFEFEVVDQSGVCARGEIKMTAAYGCDDTGRPKFTLCVKHYEGGRRKHSPR